MTASSWAAPSAFDQIKGLAGVWEGTAGRDETPATVSYEVTSGGNAVVERLFPGTDEEMTSVYYEKNGVVAMTHYCVIGNRPEMVLADSDPNNLFFELAPDSGLDPAEAHMHGLKISTPNSQAMEQIWLYYENGEQQGTKVITLKRKGQS